MNAAEKLTFELFFEKGFMLNLVKRDYISARKSAY
jgi:hypothetical protein